ncbi:MAG: MFS transporter [Actinobacteria bacterium]|nr:MAG: MFS transporter [Actinomycetota bacterium]
MLERKWWTLVVVCLAIFMLLLDITIVNVALPPIARDLGATFTDLQWVIDAYALTLATFVLNAGSLADLLGRKRVFIGGVVLFTAASVLCGAATSPLFLILSRAGQGIGGAIMFATSLALLSQEFQGRERGTAFGIWGATTGAAVAVGPLIGGALTTYLSWRWIFFVNIPIGIVATILSVAQLRETLDEEHGGIDWIGLVTLSASLFMIVFALLRGNEKGWTSVLIVGMFAGGAALLLAFVLSQHYGRRAMIDLSLFTRPAFTGAQITAFALSCAVFATFLYLTLYLQNDLGYSAIQTGVRFLPITVLSFVCAAASGTLTARVPVRFLLAVGLALCAVGLFLLRDITATSGWTTLLPGFVLMGAGIGVTNPALASTAIAVVPPARAGMASGTNNTFRQVGIATGIAAYGAIFEHHIRAAFPGIRTEQLNAFASGRFNVGNAPKGVVHQVQTTFIGGLHELFVVGTCIAAVGAVLALTLVRRRDFAAATAPAQG